MNLIYKGEAPGFGCPYALNSFNKKVTTSAQTCKSSIFFFHMHKKRMTFSGPFFF